MVSAICVNRKSGCRKLGGMSGSVFLVMWCQLRRQIAAPGGDAVAGAPGFARLQRDAEPVAEWMAGRRLRHPAQIEHTVDRFRAKCDMPALPRKLRAAAIA